MNLAQRKKRRIANRQLIDSVWRLGGDEPAQRAVNELGHRVRCPACEGQGLRHKRDFAVATSSLCSCCRGAGVLCPHRDDARCECAVCIQLRGNLERIEANRKISGGAA